jgi:exodeoxyribonuclease-3
MRLVSWNVNGLRACVTKGFADTFRALDADIFCLQETKLQPGQITLELPGYHQYWCSAEKKGYSGTALFTKAEPLDVQYNLGLPQHDLEGRVITAEYPEFYLVCVYTPNAQDGLRRLEYRMQWDDAFREFVCSLDRHKPVVICGDMNVAATEMDIKNAKANEKNAGFTKEEREKFAVIKEKGFVDSFRMLYPDTVTYSWWSYRFQARQRNAGWRLDYFMVSESLKDAVADAKIHTEIFGSDHCPVELDLEV